MCVLSVHVLLACAWVNVYVYACTCVHVFMCELMCKCIYLTCDNSFLVDVISGTNGIYIRGFKLRASEVRIYACFFPILVS